MDLRALQRGHFSRIAEVEVGINWSILRFSAWRVPWRDGWSLRGCRLGVPGVLQAECPGRTDKLKRAWAGVVPGVSAQCALAK